MKLLNKSGTASVDFFLILIISLASLVIIFMFFARVGWGQTSDNLVCHNSVILRATSKEVVGFGNFIDLNCKTQKYCFTSGFFGGKCEHDFKNAKNFQKIKISEKEDIEKFISEEIVSCWEMMGEGKISIFSQEIASKYGIGTIYPSCVICSRISFDDELDLTDEELKEIDFTKYMKTHNIPGKDITFEKYFSKGVANVEVKEDIIMPSVNKDGNIIKTEISAEGVKSVRVSLTAKPEDFEKQELAVLFMQISAPGHKDSVYSIGETALGISAASFLTIGAPVTFSLGKSAVSSCAGNLPLCMGLGLFAISAQQINVAYNQNIAAGHCVDVFDESSGKEARNGCSVVRTIPYEEIDKYCAVIESND